ncbi:Sensors of blue-light using FAD [Comamonas testosteroni]|uniref:Sensors of blue-light using FAD n=2 Tax=Comamonadaceae TaxID=80864 RepID=A0A8B4S6Y9_COMTE|nr:FAD-dependent sensor of blue light [Comamonas sp. AG1104]SUY78060.1 Sensors of blue-light using FAD [Comamonas testosteroni]
MEGPQQQVIALAKKISLDKRHTNFTPQHEARGITSRLFSGWSMAYLSVEDAEPLAQMWVVDGDAAMSCLQQLLPMLDAA